MRDVAMLEALCELHSMKLFLLLMSCNSWEYIVTAYNVLLSLCSHSLYEPTPLDPDANGSPGVPFQVHR